MRELLVRQWLGAADEETKKEPPTGGPGAPILRSDRAQGSGSKAITRCPSVSAT
jgi:hypothetical protein